MAWLSALAELDAWTAAIALASAAFYLAALLATGGVLFRFAFPDSPRAERIATARRSAIAAGLAIVLALAQWPLEAAYLGGGTLAATVDVELLAMVSQGPRGVQLVLAVTGLALIPAMLSAGRPGLGRAIACVGVVLVLLAFTQVGHTRAEPRWLLAGLLLAHLAAAAFWIGSLRPLHRLAGHTPGDGDAARILERFGRVAAAGVALLLVAGVGLAAWLLGGIAALVTTAYGQLLLGKVALVGLLLVLAAGNKWRLVPAFRAGEAQAPQRLRRSIAVEMVLVSGVLLATAVLTSVTPPNG